MGSFAGTLIGIADAQHQKHVEDVNTALDQRKNILDLYGKLLQDPNYEDASPEIASEMQRLIGIEPGKLGKELSKGYQITPVLEPSIQRAHAASQQAPVSSPPVMGSSQNAPSSPTGSASSVPGMFSLNSMITTPPGQPSGPPPAQVGMQANAIGAQQGQLPATTPVPTTVTPPGAASALQPPVPPSGARFQNPSAFRQYDKDMTLFQDLHQKILAGQISEEQGVQALHARIADAEKQMGRKLTDEEKGHLIGLPPEAVHVLNPGDTLVGNSGRTIATSSITKPPTEAETPLGAQVPNLNAGIAARWNVLNSGKPVPAWAVLPADAKKGEYDRINSQIAGMESAQAAKATRDQSASNIGTWTLAEDADGKPILLNSKTGETKAANGVQRSGTKAKDVAADEKAHGPAKSALAYADAYLNIGGGPVGPDGKPLSGKVEYTGPGDEALLEKFFELAKPSTGFRMSRPQIQMLQTARGWKEGLAAKARHAISGTWFSDQQRQQIVSTMKQIAKANEGAKPTAVSPAPGGRPPLSSFEGK